MADCIVFWQRMLTPHMTELARQLALAGAEVHYVIEEELSAERRAMGWETGNVSGVVIHRITAARDVHKLIDNFPINTVHITQGVRSNGLIAHAQRNIGARGSRHYPVIEKVDLRGISKWIKPYLYALRFWMFAGKIEGILAIGEGTPEWIARRSPKGLRAIPFAYFLPPMPRRQIAREESDFRFIFVGSLIARKRVDLIIEALSGLSGRSFELEIIGDGPERAKLERQARARLHGRVVFQGTLGMDRANDRIAAADCLVLPSAHDGWGAVVSEAQINGTPVVCSSECGASGTVRASGVGGVFDACNVASLRSCLGAMLDKGRIDEAGRQKLGKWAECLTAEAGARYLLHILGPGGRCSDGIVPPWERRSH